MPSKASSTINLGLPDIPEIKDPQMFQEFLRLYNAIKLLAQYTDIYTADGTAITQLADTGADIGAAHAELQKKYLRYTVPKFTVTGAFGTNGKSPQVSYSLGAVVTAAPIGGVGTAAGGWDTAANRNTAIAAINAHTVAINNIQLALIANGIGKV